ncbi:hypothetical protein A2W24_06570 [Microgenomates group bacterium RBG_16_45_19]|nr:MAG: hypothetical protein A2W24_06570 [Microgenomates group bacterium RBG_16_45_19]
MPTPTTAWLIRRFYLLILLVFVIGAVSGFLLTIFLGRRAPDSLTPLVNSQTQTSQSLKTIHDKLDQLTDLKATVADLTTAVNNLEQAVNLANDLNTLNQPVLGTAAAVLSPELYPSPTP